MCHFRLRDFYLIAHPIGETQRRVGYALYISYESVLSI